MIKKQTIRASATCWWSEEDDAYLVQSPLFSGCLVDAQSESEAWEEYDDALNELYVYLLENKALGHDAKGRPPKGELVNVHMQIRPDSKKILSKMAALHGLSQGEVVDWALHMAAHQTKKPSNTPSPDSMPCLTPEKIEAELERINQRISVLESSKKYRTRSK
jgi:predicted RNase H-like HicB family nuclease